MNIFVNHRIVVACPVYGISDEKSLGGYTPPDFHRGFLEFDFPTWLIPRDEVVVVAVAVLFPVKNQTFCQN